VEVLVPRNFCGEFGSRLAKGELRAFIAGPLLRSASEIEHKVVNLSTLKETRIGNYGRYGNYGSYALLGIVVGRRGLRRVLGKGSIGLCPGMRRLW
jgi:hypothetical protein